MKTIRKARNLKLESLERRELFSVDVFRAGDILKIDADRYDNSATVSQLSNGNYRVTFSTGGGASTSKSFSSAESKLIKLITFQGYQGNDTFRNQTSLPSIAEGDAGNDTLIGGSGVDKLYGDSGNDLLEGGGGADYLYGGDNNDQLAGGDGVDHLYGGNGADGLIGGDLGSTDYLHGGSGADRFLRQNGDVVKDRKSEDASIFFRDGSSRWNENELQVVDQAFAELQSATGNTRLLKDTLSSRELVFQKESSSFKDLGLNTETKYSEKYWDPWRFTWKTRYLWTERLIQIRDFNAASVASSTQAKDTVIHEIGHNWDSGGERSNAGVAASSWNMFQNISGWRTSSSSNHYKSGDGKWYYSKSSRSGFFGDVIATGRGNSLTYGKWNPHEDWATSFETWFQIRRESGPFGISGGIAGSGRNSFAQSKLDAVSDLVGKLA